MLKTIMKTITKAIAITMICFVIYVVTLGTYNRFKGGDFYWGLFSFSQGLQALLWKDGDIMFKSKGQKKYEELCEHIKRMYAETLPEYKRLEKLMLEGVDDSTYARYKYCFGNIEVLRCLNMVIKSIEEFY